MNETNMMNQRDFNSWLNTSEGLKKVYKYLINELTPIENLSFLSFKAYSELKNNEIDYIYQVIIMSEEDMCSSVGLSSDLTSHIFEQINNYLYNHRNEFLQSELDNQSIIKDVVVQTSERVEAGMSEEETHEGNVTDYSFTEKCLVEENDILESAMSSTSDLSVYDMKRMPSFRDSILEYTKLNDVSLDKLELSNRSSNSLRRSGHMLMSDIVLETEDSLSSIKNMGNKSVIEVLSVIDDYLLNNQDRLLAFCSGDKSSLHQNETGNEYTGDQGISINLDDDNVSIQDILYSPKYREKILEYVKRNDKETSSIDLSVRSKNCLLKSGYNYLSDFILESEESLKNIRNLGAGALAEILSAIEMYLFEHETRIIAYCKGDYSAYFDITDIKKKILLAFNGIGFTGLHYSEILEAINMGDIDETRIKSAIGQLIMERQLEYVDFRCYRVYGSFEYYLNKNSKISERDKEYTLRKLQGETLESIASNYGITRERVRQIIKKTVEKIHNQYKSETGLELFDEDYYRYLFENYNVDRDVCGEWLGISEKTYYYVGMNSVRGKRNLDEAIDDPNIDVSLKYRISNYINRNKVYVDGNWIELKRTPLENVVLSKYCKNEVTFDEFCELYNGFLNEMEIPHSVDVYMTEDVKKARINRLSESRMLLWKQFQKLRYYDVDGWDYTELLETLNLGRYENTELSTLKLINDNQELMSRYDIRDQYELHNLLRKIVPQGSYHDFKCGRMPIIVFGIFDRDEAIRDILLKHPSISKNELADILYDEYGYDRATTIGTYLTSITERSDSEIICVNQKVMPEDHFEFLKTVLVDDFYLIDEVKDKYVNLVKEADLSTINAFNLKRMGFKIHTKYILKNYPSFDAYIKHTLTENEIYDIKPLHDRYSIIHNWYSAISTLKSSYDIIEFEPNQIITLNRLKRVGVTKEQLREFCDSVYNYMETDSYFSAKKLRLLGFQSELYDLGFSDWFYANILSVDSRFSYGNMFKTIILYKGKKPISINSFIYDYVKKIGSIDIYELTNALVNDYDCIIEDPTNLLKSIYGAGLFYDSILGKLYINEDLYYKELDEDQEDM